MERWLRLTDLGLIRPGMYLGTEVSTYAGEPISGLDDFIDALAVRMMDHYEARTGATLPTLERLGVRTNPKTRTKRHYRQLFNNDEPNEAFRTVASEVMTHWSEESLDRVDFSSMNPPHGSEPGFDLVSITSTLEGEWGVRLLQVKATENNCAGRSQEALRGFERLQRGDYDPQLINKLRMLLDQGKLPAGIDPAELLMTENRSYCVVLVHAEDLTERKLMTKYKIRVPGLNERRTARFVMIGDWPAFWKALGEAVYAELA